MFRELQNEEAPCHALYYNKRKWGHFVSDLRGFFGKVIKAWGSGIIFMFQQMQTGSFFLRILLNLDKMNKKDPPPTRMQRRNSDCNFPD